MAHSNQPDKKKSSNKMVPSQSPKLTTDSGICSSGSSMPNHNSNEHLSPSMKTITATLLWERILKRCSSMMKVRRLSKLEEKTKELLMFDEEVKTRWRDLCYVYWHDRHCHDDQRIEDEMYQCVNALINDNKGIMIGLDSESSLKSLLITTMRICSEPNFQIEIRVGLGGTNDALLLRAPSYAIPAVQVLEQLMELRQKFPPNQIQLGEDVPTKMLINPPILTFFCAWTPGVKINNLDANRAKKNAQDILQCFKKYIDYSYPNLCNYVRYELDCENSCNEELLTHIITHYSSTYDEAIEKTKDELAAIAIKRGSNKEGSIRYASMHLIMAKDIMDKNVPLDLLDEEGSNVQEKNTPVTLYDCVITVGGSIEEKFNLIRHAVQEVLNQQSKQSNDDKYHFPLSIGILCKAGENPVYYRQKENDFTMTDVRYGRIEDSLLTNIKPKSIAQDLLILKEDIGRNLLKPIWNHIPNGELNKTSSWRNIVLSLADLCLDVWENHAKNDNRTCQCLIQNQNAFKQVCEHYKLSNIVDVKTRQIRDIRTCQILEKVLDILAQDIKVAFGETVEHLHRTWKRKQSNSEIFNELDKLLGSYLIDLVPRIIS